MAVAGPLLWLYIRRGRLVNPSPAVWEASGTTLATLVEEEGLVLREVRRRFRIRYPDRTVVPRARRDARLTEFRRPVPDRQVFSFDFVARYPIQGAD